MRRHLYSVILGFVGMPLCSIGQGWPGFANDAQHTALSSVAAQPLNRVLWTTPLVASVKTTGKGFVYWVASPLVTPSGVIVDMISTGYPGGFRIHGRNLSTGALIWDEPTDYELPSGTGGAVSGTTLRTDGSLVFPGIAGTVYVRQDASLPKSNRFQDAFYGIQNYLKDAKRYRGIQICTPLLAGPDGSVYFGYLGSAKGISAGIARVTPGHGGTWISAAAASGDSRVTEPCKDSTPALSLDGTAIYASFRRPGGAYDLGYLVKLDAKTLQVLSRIQLKGGIGEDPTLYASTASPMVGPDGDVYYGIYSSVNSYSSWMLHFTADLAPKGWPGPFGWDSTPSVVPAASVPSYSGPSSYLILTKYNDYGTGEYRVGIFDPNDHEFDPHAGTEVMRLILATPVMDEEWCVSTAAVDPITRCAIINNEDGYAYRWDFATNSLSEQLLMSFDNYESYTPTVIAPNGISLAIKNGMLFAMGK